MEVEQVTASIKLKYCSDPGVYSINPANRFGGEVVAIGCVSIKDRDRLNEEISDPYQGISVHLMGPIWGVGGLVKVNEEKFERWIRDQRYLTSGTPESKQMDEFVKLALKMDSEVWDSWPFEVRRRWLSEFIKKRRLSDPKFANCGDKFLLPD